MNVSKLYSSMRQ